MSALFDFSWIVWKGSVGILANYYQDYAQAHGPVGYDAGRSATLADHSDALSVR